MGLCSKLAIFAERNDRERADGGKGKKAQRINLGHFAQETRGTGRVAKKAEGKLRSKKKYWATERNRESWAREIVKGKGGREA